MAGGVAGGVLGLLGGMIGTWFSLRNATRPRERTLTIQLTVVCWSWIAAAVAWLFLMPRPWNQAAVFMSLPLLLVVAPLNRRLARARADDETDADRSPTGSGPPPGPP